MALLIRAFRLFAVLITLLFVGAFLLHKPVVKKAYVPDIGKPCGAPDVCLVNNTLVCTKGKCAHCSHDAECSEIHPGFHCDTAGTCNHKPLFPLDNSDVSVAILAFFTVAVASGGGIGGGGVLVAIYVLVTHFTAHVAIPLSKATIFGGACANFLYFFNKRHPMADRPRIDYDISLILEPMTLSGTTLGVLGNHVFPSWLIIFFLVTVLGYTTYKTTIKGIVIWREETGHGNLEHKHDPPPADEETKLMQPVYSYTVVPDDNYDRTTEQADEKEKLLLEASQTFPMSKILPLVGLWILMLLIELARGGHGGGLVGCGTAAYWFLFFMVFPFCIALTYYTGEHLIKVHGHRVACKYPFMPGDTLWTHKTTILYPSLCLVAGIIAGMLGVGGGMVKGPLMLEMGMLPQVQSATTAFMVLFTSSCTTAQFIIIGALQADYAFFFVVIGFGSTWIGQNVIGWLIKKYNKTSIIVFSLALMLGLSVLLIGFTGVKGVERR